MRSGHQRWSDEAFLQLACDLMTNELEWDSVDSERLHHATCTARLLSGEPVIVGVLGRTDLLPVVLDDAEQERLEEGLAVGTPIWLYMPFGISTQSLPPNVVFKPVQLLSPSSEAGVLRQVLGGQIASLRLGAWEAYSGTELPGVAGATWHRADAFVTLADGAVLCVQPWRISLAGSLPRKSEAVELQDDSGLGCVGRRIEDILEVDSETWLMLLDDGRYIANRFVPGGTSFHLGRFSDWEPDELTQPARSVATGRERDLRHFLEEASA